MPASPRSPVRQRALLPAPDSVDSQPIVTPPLGWSGQTHTTHSQTEALISLQTLSTHIREISLAGPIVVGYATNVHRQSPYHNICYPDTRYHHWLLQLAFLKRLHSGFRRTSSLSNLDASCQELIAQVLRSSSRNHLPRRFATSNGFLPDLLVLRPETRSRRALLSMLPIGPACFSILQRVSDSTLSPDRF